MLQRKMAELFGRLRNRKVLLAILTIAMLVLMTGVCLANPQVAPETRMARAVGRFYVRMIPYAVALIVIWGLLWFRKNPGFSKRDRFEVLILILAGYLLCGILIGLILYFIAIFRMCRIATGRPSARTAESQRIREAVDIRSRNSDYLEQLERLKGKDADK